MDAGNKMTAAVNEDVIDLFELFLQLRSKWKLITAVTAWMTVIATVYTFFFTTPMYSAKATIYLKSENSTASELLQGLQVGTQLAPDYEVFFKSRPVVQRVIKAENLDVSVEDLNQQVSITNPNDRRHMYGFRSTACCRYCQFLCGIWN